MFVQTKLPDLLFGSRVYPEGSVVDLPEDLGKRLIEAGHATLHAGPESEPTPVSTARPAKETATVKPPLEKRD